MKINFYLRDKDAKKETPIEFIIQHGFGETNQDGKKLYKKIKRSSGLSIKPKFWNERQKEVRENFDESAKYNSRLKEIEQYAKKIVADAVQDGRQLTIDLFKSKLDSYLKGNHQDSKRTSFFEFVEYILKTKEQHQHVRILRQTLNRLQDFSNETKYHLDFETINYDFYNLFVAFLNKNRFALNTKAKHISNVKFFMNEALKRKLHTNLDYTNFKAPKERVKNIYLSEEEIEMLYKLDLSSKPRLEKVRDLFLIGCYTGMRFSDFTQIHKTNINGRIINIKTAKTGTYVSVPLKSQALEILNKYNGNAPKAISNQKMNEYLKEIGNLANINGSVLKYKSKGVDTERVEYKKYELISTHTARRSFATNCYLAKIPPKQIMMITGHTTEAEFFKYIQIEELENAEMLLNHEYFS